MGVGVVIGTMLAAGLLDRAINSQAIGNGQTEASASLGGAFALLDSAFQRLVDPTVPAISDHSSSSSSSSKSSPAPAASTVLGGANPVNPATYIAAPAAA